jgi:stage III sporulation protein AH
MFIVWDRNKIVAVGLGILVLIGCWWFLQFAFFYQKEEVKSPLDVEVAVKKERTGPQDKVLEKQEFFVDCRLTRDRIRSQRMEVLREIAGNPASSSETRDRAQQELMKITEQAGQEMELEKLVIARGVNDAVVLLQEKSATIIIGGRSLSGTDAEEIRELIARAAVIEPGNIMIISKP